MLLDFFPSRTLTFYLARTFAARILAVLVMLVLVLMTLDLLSNSADILAHPGNGEAELAALCWAAYTAADRAFRTLFGAAGDDHHPGHLQPEQRSRGDEGVGHVGAPGTGAATADRRDRLARLDRLQRTAGDPRHGDAQGLGRGRLRPDPSGKLDPLERLFRRRQRRADSDDIGRQRNGHCPARRDVLRTQRGWRDPAPYAAAMSRHTPAPGGRWPRQTCSTSSRRRKPSWPVPSLSRAG